MASGKTQGLDPFPLTTFGMFKNQSNYLDYVSISGRPTPSVNVIYE